MRICGFMDTFLVSLTCKLSPGLSPTPCRTPSNHTLALGLSIVEDFDQMESDSLSLYRRPGSVPPWRLMGEGAEIGSLVGKQESSNSILIDLGACSKLPQLNSSESPIIPKCGPHGNIENNVQTIRSWLLKCLHHLPFNHPSFQHILIYYLLGPSRNWLWGTKMKGCGLEGKKTNAGKHLCKMEFLENRCVW